MHSLFVNMLPFVHANGNGNANYRRTSYVSLNNLSDLTKSRSDGTIGMIGVMLRKWPVRGLKLQTIDMHVYYFLIFLFWFCNDLITVDEYIVYEYHKLF